MMNGTRARVMDVSSPHKVAVGGSAKQRRPSSPLARWILSALAVLVVVSAIVAGVYWYQHRSDQVVMADRYQVVRLLSGQVYFGKLQNTNGSYLRLTHVYMLQPQPAGATATTDNSTSNLIQASRQVYGPEDSMSLRADQVEFWQNLRTDSKVAQAIASADK